jgi:hypothetical protein
MQASSALRLVKDSLRWAMTMNLAAGSQVI